MFFEEKVGDVWSCLFGVILYLFRVGLFIGYISILGRVSSDVVEFCRVYFRSMSLYFLCVDFILYGFRGGFVFLELVYFDFVDIVNL